jgi:hypothetical protein
MIFLKPKYSKNHAIKHKAIKWQNKKKKKGKRCRVEKSPQKVTAYIGVAFQR